MTFYTDQSLCVITVKRVALVVLAEFCFQPKLAILKPIIQLKVKLLFGLKNVKETIQTLKLFTRNFDTKYWQFLVAKRKKQDLKVFFIHIGCA